MKKLRLLIPVLLIAFLLNGCGFFLPYFFMNFSASAGQELQEETEELLIGSDVDSLLNADSVYWRSKLAIKDRVMQYRIRTTTQLSYSMDSFDFAVPMHWQSDVALDPDTSSVNVSLQVQFDRDEPERYHMFYRDEDGRLIRYSHIETTGKCFREEIDLDGKAPYAIIADYTIYGYPYSPVNLVLDPQTRILDGREVFMLTYEQTALDAFGYTGNTAYDEQLAKRMIPTTWYVDTQTYLPVQQTFTLTQVDDLLGQIIAESYLVSLDEDTAIAGFSYTLDNLVYERVELPPVPSEVMKKAWDDSEFSAN